VGIRPAHPAPLAVFHLQGVLGTWSFDANGDTNLVSMLGNVVKSGKWEEAPADILP
jgi:branched-chain amino acid transport system substrate-binding protein